MELELGPSSLLVDVAIICEAEEESCLTAVLPSSVVYAREAADMASWTSAGVSRLPTLFPPAPPKAAPTLASLRPLGFSVP